MTDSQNTNKVSDLLQNFISPAPARFKCTKKPVPYEIVAGCRVTG